MDRLPAELIDHLHGLLDPLSSFRLALVSRQVAAHSHDALKLHQHRAQKHSALFDADEKLAKEVLNDQAGTVGWHVRSLEFLSEGIEPTQGDDFENAEDEMDVASALIDDEKLCEIIWSVTGLDVALDLSDEVSMKLGKWPTPRQEMMVKQIGSIKLLLLDYQIAIGMPSQTDRGRPILTSKRVLPLFLLPNLDTVYVRGLTMTDHEEEEHAASGSSGFQDFNAIPARSSSVQHVCLEAVADFDQIPSMLKEHQALNLRTFLPCGDLSGLDGYRGEMDEERVDMKALKILPLCQDEIIMSSDLALSRADCPRQEAIAAESEKWEMQIDDPETIILHGTGSFISLRDQGQEGHGPEVDALDEILAGLVTAKSSYDRSDLQSVYLDKLVDALLSHGSVEPREAVFGRIRQAGARFAVRIHYEEGALDRFAEGFCRGLFGVNLALDELR